MPGVDPAEGFVLGVNLTIKQGHESARFLDVMAQLSVHGCL
jgi:hypothetical protein